MSARRLMPNRRALTVRLGAALVCCLHSGFAVAETPEAKIQIEQVRCAEIAFSDSAQSGNWSAFESFIHPGARFVGSSSVAIGPAEVTATWRGAFSGDDRTIRWRPRSVEILKPGELILSRGPYRVEVRAEDGTTTESWGTFNSVWTRENGRWQVLFDIGSESIEEGDRELLVTEASGCSGAEHGPGDPPDPASPMQRIDPALRL